MPRAADSSSAAQPFPPVAVETPITLGQFLKLAGLVDTGGDAKMLVGTGCVTVNGEVETRRGRKLWPGDTVESRDFAVTVSAVGVSEHQPTGTQRTNAPRPVCGSVASYELAFFGMQGGDLEVSRILGDEAYAQQSANVDGVYVDTAIGR